jgi:Protein of unknown function (DUF1648)
MLKTAIPLAVLALCYAVFFVYVAESFDELPQKVASHFDFYGRANGWMNRDACVHFTVGLGFFVPALIIGLMAGAGKIPVSFINLPHRDYWLAPERRKAALAVLFRSSLWFAALNVLFVTGLHGLIVQANRPDGGGHLSGYGLVIVVGAYLAATVLWVMLLMRKFTTIR